MDGVPAAAVDLLPVAPAELWRWEPAWRGVEGRAPDAPPFVCFDWLAAWASVFEPRRLAVVRVGAADAPLALGLLELAAGGRWRFAGRPVTSVRGLLAAPGKEEAAWSALSEWLRANAHRWSTLDAEGIAPGAPLPGATFTPSPTPVLALPASMDEYVAGRRSHRRLLRRLGPEIAVTADVPGALVDYVRLHQARAASLGERHPQIDTRLADLLGRLRGASAFELRVLELVRGGRRLGVVIDFDRGETTWAYSQGIDPAARALSAGTALNLASVREAIERGRRTLDLGPGAHPFKLEMGAVVDGRVDARAVSRSARGRIVDGAERLERRARGVARRLLRR
jgi:CelD/BcsL family acetyltransferase involved in cellulose biosynthesis